MDAQAFGRFVADIRMKHNMTQAQLAMKINVTDKAVSKWERGIGLPDISLLRPLASALDISIQQLMTQTDNRLTDPMSKFHITDGYIRPFGKNRRVIHVRDTDILPEQAKQFQADGGELEIRKHPENGKVTVYAGREDEEGFIMDSRYMLIEIATKPEYISEYPEPFRSYVKNGGRMYMIGESKDGYIPVTYGLEPDSLVVMEKHMWASEIFDKMTLEEILAEMKQCVDSIMNRDLSDDERHSAAVLLRNHLMHCLEMKELDEITPIYKDQYKDVVIWFNPLCVGNFLNTFTKMLKDSP